MVAYRYLRSVALVAAATSLVVIAGVLLLQLESSPRLTVQAVRDARNWFDDFRQRLDAARPYWFGLAAMILSVGLGVYLYGRRALQLEAALKALREAEIERQMQAMQSPEWSTLPPNEIMNEIARKIQELTQARRAARRPLGCDS